MLSLANSNRIKIIIIIIKNCYRQQLFKCKSRSYDIQKTGQNGKFLQMK